MARPDSARTLHRHQRARAVLWIVFVLLAFYLRVAPIGAGLPYLRYIDEGHVVHDAIKILQTGKIDTGFYNYPALPSYLIAGVTVAYAPVYTAMHGRSFWNELQREGEPGTEATRYYDYVWPSDVIVVARAVVLFFSVATVVLAGMLARLLGGSRAALLALLITALCPALVSRGSIVIVDTLAAFFALAALYFAQRLQPNTVRPARYAAAAGVAAGLAFTSKYMAGAVFLAVLVRLLIARRPTREKAQLILVSGAALVLASVVTMPTLVLQAAKVFETIRGIAGYYDQISYGTSYWRDAITTRELGIPLVLAAAAGIALLLQRSRATRVAAISWLAFAVALAAPMARANYQPFRNLLPLVPAVCVAAAFLLARGDWWFRDRRIRQAVNDWFEPAAALIVTLSLAIPAWREVERQRAVIDTRVAAMNWLREHVRPEDRVVAVQELAVHPMEWQRLATKPIIAPWFAALDLVETGTFEYVISSDFDLQFAPDQQTWSAYREAWNNRVSQLPVAASFGSVPCFLEPGVWRTNDERIVILRGRAP